MAGYFFWNSATSFLMSGTQVQKVSSVGVCIALSMSACETGLAALAPPLLLLLPPPPPHAARARLTAATAAAASVDRRPRELRVQRIMLRLLRWAGISDCGANDRGVRFQPCAPGG